MIDAFVFGLVVAIVPLSILALTLRKHARELKARKQAFMFHALRDDLQDLVLNGIVQQDGVAYRFLYMTVNLGIANAGTLRLRDILRIAQQVDTKVQEQSQKLWRDIRTQDEQVQSLVAETFSTLTQILIANDILVSLGFRAAVAVWTVIDRIAQHVVPVQAAAVNYARHYNDLSGRLAS